MKEVCGEIFVQSRDVRKFFNRSIPVIASLQHDGVFLPRAESWSSHGLSPPEYILNLVQGFPFLTYSDIRLFSTGTRTSYQCYPSRDFSLTRNFQFQHGL